VPHTEEVYLPCKILKKDGDTTEFQSDDGTKIKQKTSALPSYETVHGEQLQAVNDICALSVVCEAAMLHTVRMRYAKKEIYTNVSRILIAMNPFCGLPIYNKEYMDKYSTSGKGSDLAPHIYGIGQDAMSGLRQGLRDQAILISGESGAGKTESAKLVLSFVSEALRGKAGGIEEQILRTNPVLEAFGNAKTERNNNSSRFGKWLDLNFADLKMTGVTLTSYLLEASRVCNQSKNERAYHVFFQLLQARKQDKHGISAMELGEPSSYRYLKSGEMSAPGIDDGKCFLDMTDAYTALKFSPEIQTEIFNVLGGVLCLGNCDFKDDNDEAKIVDAAVAAKAAKIWKLDQDAIIKIMISKKIMVGKDAVDKPVRGDQAPQLRDSISRLVYGKLFLWLIEKMNKTLIAPDPNATGTKRLLGVLDIAGFESFEINSLEQMLINLSNEHLQQQFNNTVFKTEMEDYKKEGISLGDMQFTDNSDVLQLLDSKGSILDLLDEAIALPKCNDQQYVQNCIKAHEKHPRFVKPKFAGKAMYSVKHFAGEVLYTCDGFMEKNADKPPDDLPNLLKTSGLTILQEIGQTLAEDAEAGKTGPGQKKKAKTTCSGFRKSLGELMNKINAADPHYIRCIKPNKEKVPDKVTSTMVYQQLLFSGVFDAINIRRQGYSSRMPFREFCARYSCIVEPAVRKQITGNNVDAVKKLMENIKFSEGTVAVGNTKVLLKQVALNKLESAREIALLKPAIHIQKCWRRHKAIKSVKDAKEIQRELRAWLKQSSVFNDGAAAKAAANKKRLSVKEASTSAIKRLGSPEAVEASLAKVTPLIQRAEKIKFSSPLIMEASKTMQRMKMELECLETLKGMSASVDPVALDKALVRSKDLGLPDNALTAQLTERVAKIREQLPLATGMKAVVDTNAADDMQLVQLVESLKAAKLFDNSKDWLAELDGAALLTKIQGFWTAKPELHAKKTDTAKPGARKTVTGCGPAQQAKILHELDEAAEQFDVEALEVLLNDAVKNGIPASSTQEAQSIYQSLHTEDFLAAKVHELVPQKGNKKVLKQLQNLAKQIRKLQGPEELYSMAASAAQKVGRKTLASNELQGSIFDDLSSFQGLKTATVDNAPKALKHSLEQLSEALTKVDDSLENKAVQCFRNIMIGMYDKPASDIEVMSSRQAVMELACSEGGLRNEIYIQAMKQITENPSERSILMGWQLIRFLCQASPPRPDLIEFVEAFASRALSSSICGVPDAGFLKAAGIAEEDWGAYTVNVAREAEECLNALSRPQSWVLASAPNSSTVALQAKSQSGYYGQSQATMQSTGGESSQRAAAQRSGNTANACTNCVTM